MDKLTIRQKLFLVFGCLIAIFVVNGAYTGYSLSSINDGALRIATEHLSNVLTASDAAEPHPGGTGDEEAGRPAGYRFPGHGLGRGSRCPR